jgi:hypothetical protein
MSTPLPVTPIPALTPYTCGLACLESVFLDMGRPLSQSDMLKQFYPFLLNPDPEHFHEYGSTTPNQIIGICQHLGFKIVQTGQDFTEANCATVFGDWLSKDVAVLIYSFWQGKYHHCVRLSKILTTSEYEVVNPSLAHFDITKVLFSDLVSWQFGYIAIGK